MFTWLVRAGLAQWDAQCWLGHMTTCMPHDWTDCQDLGQPGADKRQTLLLDKGGSSSPLPKNQHPHPITSQQLLTISRGLETKAAVSNCDAPHTRSCLPGTIQGGKWRNHTFQRLIWHCKQQSGSHLHGQSTWIYFSNFPMEEKSYDLRWLMAKFKYNLRSYYTKK